jgi:hypothetical protein
MQIDLDESKAMIEAKGDMRVTSEDGTEYILPIVRVSYRISASGINCDIELGNIERPLDQGILDIYRRVESESRLSDKRTAQLFP